MKKNIYLAAAMSLCFLLATEGVSYGAAAGWTQQDGKWYYTDSGGYIPKNQMKIVDSKKYYFDGNGVMLQNSWWQDGESGKWYYLSGDGSVAMGWLQLGSEWYYLLPSSGVMVSDGWRTIDEARYYFNPNGSMRKNGYVQEKYLNDSGVNDSRYDIKVRGKIEKNVLEDAGDHTANIPGWLMKHIFESGWKIACNAEVKDYGVLTHEDYEDYIRYCSLETGRKLIFFISPEYVTHGIGLYLDNSFGKPSNTEDFQGAFSVDYGMASTLFEQDPILEKGKNYAFAEVFALYYNKDESVREQFRTYCPSLYEYMNRLMAECYQKSLTNS